MDLSAQRAPAVTKEKPIPMAQSQVNGAQTAKGRGGDLLKTLKGRNMCFFSQTNVYASTQSQGGKGLKEGHSLRENRRTDPVEKLPPFWFSC